MGQPELLNAKFAYTLEHVEVNTSLPTLLETSIFFRLGSYVSFFDLTWILIGLAFPSLDAEILCLFLAPNFYCSCLKKS